MLTLSHLTDERNTPVAIVDCPLTPYQVGQLDAQEHLPFAPETYFFWWGDLLEYTAGFESVAGESAITADFKNLWPTTEPAIEDDYAWIAQGC